MPYSRLLIAASVCICFSSARAAHLRVSSLGPREDGVATVGKPPPTPDGSAEQVESGWATGSDAEKVARLLRDVDEIVQKARHDANLVYKDVANYDQRVEHKLRQEIEEVSKEFDRLKKLKVHDSASFSSNGAPAAASPTGVDGKNEIAPRSNRTTAPQAKQSGTDQTPDPPGREAALTAIKFLLKFMQHGNMHNIELNADQKHLGPTAVLRNSFRSFRHLLVKNQGLRPHYVDVYEAFVPLSFAQDGNSHRSFSLKVRLTQSLRSHSIAVLRELHKRLMKQKLSAKAFLQKNAVSVKTSDASANADGELGLQAEKKQQIEEIAFCSNFAEAVLNLDSEFLQKVHGSMSSKAQIVEAIQKSRESQHRMLTSVMDVLTNGANAGDGSTNGDEIDLKGENDPDADMSLDVPDDDAPSFLQISAKSAGRTNFAALHDASNLQVQIERAIKNKENTHDYLVKIKAMMHRAAPVDSEEVHTVVNDLTTVLQEVQREQSKIGEMKVKCDAQKLHAAREEHGLFVNLALMKAVRNRTQAVIGVAKHNLQTVLAKIRNLENSTNETVDTVTRSTSTLQNQGRDRKIIMTAVQKAREIVAAHPTMASNADSMMVRILQALKTQDSLEHDFRVAEVNFKNSFGNYANEYLQLLRERREHYESSLSALELYVSEVDADEASQTATISANKVLQKQNTELCEGVLRAFASETRRRQELTRMLRRVVPAMPNVLS